MVFSFAIIDGMAATTVKLIDNIKTQERLYYVCKCKEVTNTSLTQERKPEIPVREFVFHYAIYYFAYLKRQRTLMR